MDNLSAMLTPDQIVWAFAALFLKHFICDFPLQVPYHYRNKGTYGHIGGISHASIHAIGTFIALSAFADHPGGFELHGPHIEIVTVAVFDLVVHYHVDYAKVQINRHFHWGPTTHEQFWWLLGLDQFLHAMTYVAMIWWIKT